MEVGRDQAGAKIYIGSRVCDDFFGEGEVTGKVACGGGGGFNVVVNWDKPPAHGAAGKDSGRGAQHLTVITRARVIQQHTGAEFESGDAHRARGVNDADMERLHQEQQWAQQQHSPARLPPAAAAASPQSMRAAASPPSLRSSPGTFSPRAYRHATREARGEAEDELQALLRKPWRGQAESLKAAQKRVLAQFEERGVREKVLNDGVMIEVAKTKYWVRADGEGTAKVTTRLNITRLFEELLKSKHCPASWHVATCTCTMHHAPCIQQSSRRE